MVRTQLYIFTQNSTYNYMFRPCMSAIVRLYCKLNKRLYDKCVGCCGWNEISSYISGGHGFEPLWTSVYSCVILSLETLPPPGDPSRGVVYLWIVLSPEEASQLMGNY